MVECKTESLGTFVGGHVWGPLCCANCGGVPQDSHTQFAKGLESLINRFSQENGSDTPDFILAQYLLGCLSAWNDAVKMREKWYGRHVESLDAASTLLPAPKP